MVLHISRFNRLVCCVMDGCVCESRSTAHICGSAEDTILIDLFVQGVDLSIDFSLFRSAETEITSLEMAIVSRDKQPTPFKNRIAELR